MTYNYPPLKSITGKKQWSALLEQIGEFDFYHTFDYHLLSLKENQQAILIVYEIPNNLIVLPLCIRPIDGTDYFDATSVYGYVGPLAKYSLNNHEILRFHKELCDFFRLRKIISVYSSLNPYIKNQESILAGIGHIETRGEVVNINLSEDSQSQFNDFSNTTKRYIKKADKLCYVRVGKSQKDLQVFIELYYENLDRLNASEFYYFKKDYFTRLIESDDFETVLVFTCLKDTDKEISAAIMIRTNKKIIQYHLSGTLEKYLNLSPIRILIDTIRTQGTKDGYTFFNLGGGFASKKDSLFSFKSSFSNDYKVFKIWKFIVNKDVYDRLCDKKNLNANSANTSFFPLYRFSP